MTIILITFFSNQVKKEEMVNDIYFLLCFHIGTWNTVNYDRCLLNGIVNICNLNYSIFLCAVLSSRSRLVDKSEWTRINESLEEDGGSQRISGQLQSWHSGPRSDDIHAVNRHLESNSSGRKSQHEWSHFQVHTRNLYLSSIKARPHTGLQFSIC